MKENIVQKSKKRLERMILQERISNPNRLSSILRSEIAHVLESYMSVENIKFSIVVGADGKYEVLIKAMAGRLYS